jgi:hypothetical protein
MSTVTADQAGRFVRMIGRLFVLIALLAWGSLNYFVWRTPMLPPIATDWWPANPQTLHAQDVAIDAPARRMTIRKAVSATLIPHGVERIKIDWRIPNPSDQAGRWKLGSKSCDCLSVVLPTESIGPDTATPVDMVVETRRLDQALVMQLDLRFTPEDPTAADRSWDVRLVCDIEAYRRIIISPESVRFNSDHTAIMTVVTHTHNHELPMPMALEFLDGGISASPGSMSGPTTVAVAPGILRSTTVWYLTRKASTGAHTLTERSATSGLLLRVSNVELPIAVDN